MSNQALITKFYTAFTEGNSKNMTDCYHKEVVFQDPAFGILEGERAKYMWEMLLSRKTADFKLSFDNIESTEENGTANWIAEYVFGDSKRSVVNHVTAKFKFKDGLIIEHIDSFDIWKWSKQALGTPGYLLGWSGFMKNKIQKTTNFQLDTFIEKKKAS